MKRDLMIYDISHIGQMAKQLSDVVTRKNTLITVKELNAVQLGLQERC